MIAFALQEVIIAKSNFPTKKHQKIKAKGVKIPRRLPAIVIDQKAGLVFETEKELYDYFDPQVQHLEKEYNKLVETPEKFDFDEKRLAEELDLTLDEPAEIWYDDKTFKKFPIFHFIRPLPDYDAFHVVVCYVSAEDEPTFIFLNFFSREIKVVSKYQRGDLIYDRAFEEVGFGAIDGDSLSEGDPMAIGLFLSMLKVRQESDVAFEKWQELGAELRDDTIQNADEIWRTVDLQGNTLVTFIKDFEDHAIRELRYVAITQEDTTSSVHSLLFSFPTTDTSLVDRYRHGENLQTEEVSQESSH